MPCMLRSLESAAPVVAIRHIKTLGLRVQHGIGFMYSDVGKKAWSGLGVSSKENLFLKIEVSWCRLVHPKGQAFALQKHFYAVVFPLRRGR